jgi:broad specificity phosphatase PhoE
MIRMRSVTLALLFAVAFAAFAHEPTTVILVRHAEKSLDPAFDKDPPLTVTGQERARELARVLAGTPVDAIFTTTFKRTRETAASLATAKKVTAEAIDPMEAVARIRKDFVGKTVVVVGHSNTTRDVMKALGIADAPFIPESEFDNFFIVTLTEGKPARMIPLKYGAAVR